MSTEIRYLIGYGSYLDPEEVKTVVDEQFVSYRGRVAGFMRVFNLPHGSYRYPIKGNLKGVMNVIPREDKHMNVSIITIPNEESWERIEKREGKMYNKVMVEAFLTDEQFNGESVQATMFVGKPNRINENLYPLPEYYKICRDAAENLGETFFREYLETTFMQANGAFVSLQRYEDNMATGQSPQDFIRRTGSSDSMVANMQGMPFSQMTQMEQLDVKRDYYLEEIGKNIVYNDTTNKLYEFIFQHNKVEFYRGTLGFEAHLGDQSIWSAYERGIDVTKGVDIFFDTRKNIPFMARHPFKVVVDRKIIKHPSLAVQTVAQVILGVLNPMTLQPWGTGKDGIQMIWRHYMDGLLNTAITIERHNSDINLLEPDFFANWEPGMGTSVNDNFVPTFDALTAINNELVARRELVQFPLQLPINYEGDYREEASRGAYWKSWMWFYSKYDRDTQQVYTFAKFEEELEERDFLQVCMANTSNKIKYKRRTFTDGHEIKYIMSPMRNYRTLEDIELVSDQFSDDDYEDLLYIEGSD